MKLDQEAIAEYQKIHAKDFGEDISEKEVIKQGENATALYRLILNINRNDQ